MFGTLTILLIQSKPMQTFNTLKELEISGTLKVLIQKGVVSVTHVTYFSISKKFFEERGKARMSNALAIERTAYAFQVSPRTVYTALDFCEIPFKK